MTDLFEEVEEQLRTERYRAMVMKALPWVLGAAAAALIAAFAWWGWQHYSKGQVDKASEEYQAAIDDMSQGRQPEAEKLWSEVAQSGARGYKSLALMQLAGLRLGENKRDAAVKLFDQAADAAPDPLIGDAARLKSAFALLDTAPEKDVEARLDPLMKEGRPYRAQAREALGFAKLMAGDLAGARSQFVILGSALDAPDGARERAHAAIDLIDSGSAKEIAGVAKAAAALPPPVMLAPGQTTPNLPAQQPQASAPQ